MSVRSIQTAILSGCLCTLGFLSAGSAMADVITYDFNDGTTQGLFVSSITPGFSATVSGGALVLSKTAGTGDGYIALSVPFKVSGDFTVTVATNRAGIGSGDTGMGYDIGDVFLWSTAHINTNFVLPNRTSALVSDSTVNVTLGLSRAGNTITAFYDTGSGRQTLQSRNDASYGATDMTFALFLMEEFHQTTPSSVQFDNLTITFVPEPAAVGLLAVGGLVLLRRRA